MNGDFEYSSDAKHVVFGATGSYGCAIVKALQKRKKNIVAVCRNEQKATGMFSGNVEIVNADIMDKDQVMRSCEGASFVYLGFNFPYSDWEKKYRESIRNVMSGCSRKDVLIVFPGNVYGYGKFNTVPVPENHPLNARSRKGIIRNRIELDLIENHRKGKFRVVIPKFADFYGPNVTNDLTGAPFRNAIHGDKTLWPVNADVPHQFTFIDDAAEGTMKLIEDPESYGHIFHLSGNTINAREFINKIYLACGRNIDIQIVPKLLLTFMGIFKPQIREFLELSYEYKEPYILDDSKLRKAFPEFTYTPYDEGIRQTLDWFNIHLAH